MGMTIDKATNILNEIIEEGWLISDMEKCIAIDACEFAIDTMRKYQMFQVEYVKRLKADMVAMLTEIQLEIEELDLEDVVPEYQDGAEDTREYIANILEEKINLLKAEIEPQESEDKE